MDPVTHFMTGGCMGRAGLNRFSGLATLTLVLAAEAPDIDVVAGFWGPIAGFRYHRGFTHTLIGVPVMAALVLGIVWICWRLWSRNGKRTTRVEIRWGVLYGFAVLATLSHILLDFTNDYGVRPFWPWNPRWYEWDTVFIIEPVLLTALLFGLILPAVLGWVQKEISKQRVVRNRWPAVLALSIILLTWIVRGVEHHTAVQMLSSREAVTGATLRVAAMPYPVNPYHWFGIVETSAAYETFDLHTNAASVVSAGRPFYKQDQTRAAEVAKNTDLGRVYLDWSQYPYVETNDVQGGWDVSFADLRFMYPAIPSRQSTSGRRTLGADVVLDRDDHVVEEYVGAQKAD